MKNISGFPLLTLATAAVATLLLAGCRSRSTAPQPVVAQPAPPPMPTPTVAPKAPYPEDERYRATSLDNVSFGPDAKPEDIETYKAAMAKAHQFRPPLDMKVPDTVKVVLQTSRGPVTLQLDAQAAPLHVKSFVYLADKGFYNGTSFHRHEALRGGNKGFIIQGGDPLTKDAGAVRFAGLGGPGYTVPLEENALKHDKLVVAAARTYDPDSAGSQFYITQDTVPSLDEGDGYTVFGKVVAGKEAAMKLTQGDILQSVKIENGPQTPATGTKAKAGVKAEATKKPQS